jgi:glutamyl-tRNA synthetase
MDPNLYSQSSIRVRFAPSPTGYLHIGGARTALFNWLFARHSGGTFILRIEDTDIQRSTEESADAIVESLRWLGLDWDEGPLFQSQRSTLYEPQARRLVDEGRAYCSDEKKGVRPAVILKAPEERIVVEDMIHGTVSFEPEVVGELVLMKSDGTPTYNFACVVDDADMGITHIIRGDDHLSNTPKQLMIYHALGLAPPLFAHVPLIMGPDGKRLSKRHGATAVGQFRDDGILPEALVNFLALLGWSPGDDREMMSLQELIASFSLDRISSKSAVFDTKKLLWLNMQYLKTKSAGEIAQTSLPFFDTAGIPREGIDAEKLERVVKLLGERFRSLKDLPEQSSYFFTGEVRYDEKAVARHLRLEGVPALLNELADRLGRLGAFDTAGIEHVIRGLIAERGLKPGDVMQPARVAVSGRAETPGLFEVMAILGKDTTLSRLRHASRI